MVQTKTGTNAHLIDRAYAGSTPTLADPDRALVADLQSVVAILGLDRIETRFSGIDRRGWIGVIRSGDAAIRFALG